MSLSVLVFMGFVKAPGQTLSRLYRQAMVFASSSLLLFGVIFLLVRICNLSFFFKSSDKYL